MKLVNTQPPYEPHEEKDVAVRQVVAAGGGLVVVLALVLGLMALLMGLFSSYFTGEDNGLPAPTPQPGLPVPVFSGYLFCFS